MFETAALLAVLKRWWPALLAAVVIIAGIATVYLRGVSNGKSGELVKASTREAEVQVLITDANENASAARVEATAALQNQAQELTDAEQETDSLDTVRIKRGCVVLRQQGRDVSKIPACR